MSPTRAQLNEAERAMVGRALRQPRGRYGAERASQLAGIPVRTLQDWAATGTLRPDRHRSEVRGWSYRDLLLARLVAWLRAKHMARPAVAERVARLRALLDSDEMAPTVRSDGTTFLVGSEHTDRFTGQHAFDGIAEALDVFDLVEPPDRQDGRPWWPNLVHPSPHTSISPWVAGGEPCVTGSRVPTRTLHALHTGRGLAPAAIAELYGTLSADAVADALDLETRLPTSTPPA